jgi:hypothetical protein
LGCRLTSERRLECPGDGTGRERSERLLLWRSGRGGLPGGAGSGLLYPVLCKETAKPDETQYSNFKSVGAGGEI